MQCELCGREDELVEAVVEGSILSVCNQCSKYGHVIAIKKTKVAETPKKIELKLEDDILEVVVKDYSEKVKKAREGKKLTQEELAKKINEKESLVQKIESGHLEPSLYLAKKLENFLQIKLIEKESNGEKVKIDFKGNGLTIGDLVSFKNK